MARILVIDDQEAVRVPLRTALEMAGHRVREASNGGDGLAQQQTEPADLVITDLRMPGMPGVELIQRLRADYPATKVIAMSAVDDNLDSRLGANDVIQKPFGLKDVVARVAGLLSED